MDEAVRFNWQLTSHPAKGQTDNRFFCLFHTLSSQGAYACMYSICERIQNWIISLTCHPHHSFLLGYDISLSCWLDMDAQIFIFITISFECISIYQTTEVVNIQPGV